MLDCLVSVLGRALSVSCLFRLRGIFVGIFPLLTKAFIGVDGQFSVTLPILFAVDMLPA